MSAVGGATGVQGPKPEAEAAAGVGAGAAARAGAGVGTGGRTEPARHRKGRRRYVAAAGLLAITIAGGTAAFALTASGGGGGGGGRGGGGDDGTRSGKGGATSAASTAITRGDIVDTESVEGTLTYAGERTISGMASGVVTATPTEGSTVTRGRPLLRVNDKPVILMYGSLPLFRTLREGVDDGRDVRQLERNLKALGYGDDLTVDTEFTALTADAVREWQDDVGLPETGVVDASQVVFQPAAVRIGDVKTSVGARLGPGGQALTVTGTKPIVHVDLDAGKQDLAVKGAKVDVELPDGKQVKGKITKVGTVAESTGSGDGAQGDDETAPTIDVEIGLSGGPRGRLDQAPVSVDLESRRSRDVLSVPVEALLGLREGGFGVEVVEAGGTGRIVPVEIGAFGGGRVEVTGEGLREGMKVGVPAS